jgi:ABC-type glycerol-3-phosphate transport system permease component
LDERTSPSALRLVSRRPRAVLARKSLATGAIHLVLVAIAFTMVLPFVWMALTSLKTLPEVGLADWLPRVPRWGNYSEVFEVVPFRRFYFNSVLVAAWVTLLQVLTSAMAAFSFARLNWPGRDKVFMLYLSTMMLPGLVTMIPNYQIMINLRLVDTLAGLIIPASFSAFGTFLLRQFLLTIPRSIDEAAEIDGAGPWRLFWDIILPLARPGLITLTIFTFIGNYQSFFWPLVMLRRVENYTLPVGLLYFDSSRGQTTHLLMAAVTMSVVPLIIVFVVLQKYLVKGIQLGSVKG